MQNRSLLQDRYELDRLRELYELSERYSDYPTVGARVIGKGSGNWFRIFLIDKGEADLIISFEMLEAARYVEYLKKGGVIITNTQQVNPMPVITGAQEYPENLEEKIKAKNINLDAIDALALANQAGNSKAVNIVLLGRLSKQFDFSEVEWMEAIEQSVPEKFLELNKKAFLLGRNFEV